MTHAKWAEDVAAAQATGARVYAPNGLPILCIRHDSVTLEHEHADHPDYRFPVEVEYIGDPSIFVWCTANGDVPMTPEEIANERTQTHALIYSDGIVAVTLYECTYATWLVQTGECIGGRCNKVGDWKLSDTACARLSAWRLPPSTFAEEIAALDDELIATVFPP
jgi:hypothetical protein